MNINSRISKVNFTGYKAGTIASFTGLREALTKVKVNAIGVSECNVVNINQDTSTEYFRGLLVGTFNYIDLGTLTYNKYTAGELVYFIASIPGNIKRINAPTLLVNMLCSDPYNIVTQSVWNNNLPCITKLQGLNNNILISNHDFDNIDASELPSLLSGVYLIYELENTITPTITKTQFETLLRIFDIDGKIYTIQAGQTVTQIEQNIGSNNIFSDAGNVEVYYVTV